MRYLLDKNIVRFALVGLRLGRTRSLSFYEEHSIRFIREIDGTDSTLLISNAAFHIVSRWTQYPEVQGLLARVNVLYPTRYHKRWSRRVRETAGLTREDSAMVALATFGGSQKDNLFGANFLVTFDQPLVNGYMQHKRKLSQRLNRMRAQLRSPFDKASMPDVLTPLKAIL